MEQNQILLNVIPILFFFLLFYLFMIRPTQQQELKRAKMVEELKNNDRVRTNAGIIGAVKKVKEKTIIISSGTSEIEISKDNLVEKLVD